MTRGVMQTERLLEARTARGRGHVRFLHVVERQVARGLAGGALTRLTS